MLFRTLHATTALVTILCATGWVAEVRAQTSAPTGFTIEAQDLNGALVALSRSSRRNILFDPAVAAGKRAPRIERAASFEDALRQLLNGSGLRFEITPDGSAVVLRQEAASSAPATLVPPRETRRAADEPPPEELTVTGTRIRGAIIASPVIAQTQKQILDAGLTNLGDVARSLPQNFNGGQNPGITLNVPESRGSNLGSGSAINLRGLGQDATLTLLNGHRLAYSSVFQGVDVSAIPVAAVDRIEIVADGSSALYGSDAVGGVVNIILKRDYSGVTTTARVGASTDGGNQQQQYSVVGGTTWDGGGFIATYDYEYDKPIRAKDRSYASELVPGQVLYPQIKHDAVTLSGHQEILPNLTLDFDGFYNKRWSLSEVPVTQIGTGFTVGQSVTARSESFAVAPSLKWTLGRWRVELQTMYGEDKSFYQSAITLSPDLKFQTAGCYCNTAKSAELNADGPLFSLPAGDVRVAVGGGVRSTAYNQRRILPAAAGIDVTQDNYYGFGEVNVPLVAPAQRVPFIEQLSASAAVRYENYPGVDSIATPKFGLVYAPIADVELKASWGKSFKAPTFYHRYSDPYLYEAPASTAGGIGYPSTAMVLNRSGGNDSLQPERATTWTATIAARPEWLGRTHVELSYFNVDYTDRIVSPISSSQALSNPIYRNRVTYNPSAAQQAAFIGTAVLNPYSLGETVNYNPADVVALIDNRYANAAAQSVHGFDLAADKSFDLRSFGTLTVTLSASYLESTQQLDVGQPIRTIAGLLYYPPHVRGRAGAVWERAGLSLSSYVNYIGGVKRVTATEVQQLSAMTTLDLAARYRIDDESSWLRGLDLGLSVQNFFNAKPSRIPATSPLDASFDSTNYSAVGRFIGLTISKSW